MKKKILAVISKIIQKAQHRHTAFVIGNSSELFSSEENYYLTPLRESENLIYAGVIVKNTQTAQKISKIIDGKVTYVFVDAEKKIRKMYYGPNDAGNIERTIKENIFKSTVLTYKGNDLAVEAMDLLLGQLVTDLARMNIAIIGCGNLGSKIALKLVERGARIRVLRRDQKKLRKIVSGLNIIKSEYTISKIKTYSDIGEICKNVDIIIGCTNERGVIGQTAIHQMNKYGPQILIDVGKGCFTQAVAQNPKCKIYRLDVSVAQKAFFSAIVTTHLLHKKTLGRKQVSSEGVSLVSLGLLGRYGEVVVDNIDKPTMVLGIADGEGRLLQDEILLKNTLNRLQKIFNLT